MTATGADAELSTDGRVRRAERSRAAIVGALFDLVGRGVMRPTAQAVAEYAGVGVRTVFRHFDDMESLYLAMSERLGADVMAMIAGRKPSGSLSDRAKQLIDQRVALYEKIAPFKRCGSLHRWESEFLRKEHAVMVRELRKDLVRWIPELEPAPSDVVSALELATSFEAWDRLRIDQRLGKERAARVVEQMVLSILKSGSRGNMATDAK